MEFELKRKVKREVEETVVMELQKYWVVRVIKGWADKSCVHEVEYVDCIPNEQGIAQAIFEAKEKYKGDVKLFATVAENFRFVEKE